MKIFSKSTVLLIYMAILTACSQTNTVNLGKLDSGADVSFQRNDNDEWDIEISGENSPVIMQKNPAQIEVFNGEDNVIEFLSGYQTVKKESNMIIAKANIVTEGGQHLKLKISGAFQEKCYHLVEK